MSWQMAQLHGHNNSYNSNGAEQWWNVKRSLEIHRLFDTVFGEEARTRVVRVLATQMWTAVTDGAPHSLALKYIEYSIQVCRIILCT